MKRYLHNAVFKDLAKKMVLLTGPRQVGKTYLAREIMAEYKKPVYLNYDALDDARIINARQWAINSDLLIFDEIHKANLLPIQIPWPQDKRLMNICQALLSTPDQLKDLSTWADEIGTSSRTLLRMFQKETGLSYRAWVQQMHIAHALSKIASGESVAQSARSLGYSNPSAFSTMFKRHLGQTPQQFKYKDE